MSPPSIAAPALTFLGDLVAPEWCVPRFAGFRASLGDAVPVVNLEGPILADFGRAKPRSAVKFNLASAPGVLDALGSGPAICTIANNHYEDFAEIVPPQAVQPDIGVIGDGDGTPLLSTIGGRAVVLVGIAFPATDPLRWRSLKRIAIEPPRRSLRRLEQVRRRYPDAILIAVVHWGYEFSHLPFPADRAWARRAFAAGVDLVIGHHPHVIQPIERFGDKTVVYSLGNFFIPDGDYFGNELKFPSVCDRGLAVRFDGSSLACFETVPDYKARDVALQPIDSDDQRLVAAFAGQSDREYRAHFRDAVRQRRARLPFGIPPIADYFGWGGLSETALLAAQDSRQFARDSLLRLGLHNPYRS